MPPLTQLRSGRSKGVCRVMCRNLNGGGGTSLFKQGYTISDKWCDRRGLEPRTQGYRLLCSRKCIANGVGSGIDTMYLWFRLP